MKQNFSTSLASMTSFFRRTLFFVLLFGGVCNVWGDDLLFKFTSVGHPDGQSAPQKCKNYDDKDKVIMDGDFTYSSGTDDVKYADEYVKINNSLTACTRYGKSLNAGDYTFTITTKKFEEAGAVNTPTISIDGGTAITYPQSSLSYAKDAIKNLEYDVTISSSGSHDIQIVLPSGNGFKFGVQKLSITSKTSAITYALTLTNDGHGNAASNQQDDSVIPENTSVTITATPSTGYKFVNWTDNNDNDNVVSTSKSYTFSMTGNKSYKANFTTAQQYTVSVQTSNENQGTVSGGGTNYEGQEVTITANPKSGYKFQRWDDNNTVNPRTVTISGNVTYTAYFEEDNKVNALIVTGTSTNKGGYIAEWSKGDGGTIDIDNVNDSKFGHQVLKFTYEMPNSGSYAGITVPKDGGYSSSSSADATGFGFWYKTESSSDNVAFVLDPDEGSNQMKMLLPGTNGTWLYKYCASGQASNWNRNEFRVWMNKNIDGVGQTANASGNIYISEIRATEITQITYALTLSSSDQSYGTVACTSHPGTMSAIPSGASVTVEATENEGSFVRWVDENGTELSTSSQYTFTMTGHKTVTGVFSAPVQKYTVSATMGKHGASVSGTGDYAEDASVTLEAKADENYSFKNWSNVSGVELTSAQLTTNPLKFTMPANPVSVKANFEFEAVENIIATGTSDNIGTRQGYGHEQDAAVITSIEDGAFDHNVLSYAYHMSTTDANAYCGYNIPTDDGYTANNKATGLAFYYKTDGPVYMEIKVDDHSKVFKLNGTGGVWKYAYLPDTDVKTGTNFSIWINYTKDGHSMTSQDGVLYLSEIQTTNITTKPDKSSCGTCFPVNFGTQP